MVLSQYPKLRFILLNLLAAIILILIISNIVLWRLDGYTQHGHTISVPSFTDLMPEDAGLLAKKNGLRIMVVDSLYEENATPGSILEQYPAEGAQVKENRMIQLTICASNPEQVIFPQLQNSPYRQTLQNLKSKGFKIGTISYAPSDYKNLVLDLKNKGRSIKSETLLRKGSVIDIVLGSGNYDDNEVPVPALYGLSVEKAISMLQEGYLNIGEIIPDATIKDKNDREMAIVYRQEPYGGPNTSVSAGSFVTLYISLNKNKIQPIDSLASSE